MRPAALVLALLTIVCPVLAQPPAQPPEGEVVGLGQAAAVEKEGKILLRVEYRLKVIKTVTTLVPETVFRDEVIDGIVVKVAQVVTTKVTERVPVVEIQKFEAAADGKTVQVTRKDGSTVEPKDLLRLLEKQQTVVVVVGDEKVPPALLEKTDDKTFIVRLKGSSAPAPSALRLAW